ncbi:MAG: alpha/beta hydrolase [Coriobacteriia bacterium]|nr:alpha/beta hydrolase [Coriobacteriia bacterium]
MFEPQIETFDDSYDLVFWDARGHGLSRLSNGKRFSFEDMVNDCLKLYEVLGIEKAAIVGQSMGGNLAQEIAYHHSEVVEKLILIGCTKNTGRLTAVEKFSLKLSGPIFAIYPWNLLLTQSANACGNKEHVRQYAKDCFEQLGKSAFVDIVMAVTKCLHEDTNFRFKQPVLLLCGTDDKSGNIKQAMTQWAEIDDNCTLHLVEGAAHNANQDKSEIVNNYITQFLLEQIR